MRFNVVLNEGHTQQEMSLRELCRTPQLDLTDTHIDDVVNMVEGDSIAVPGALIIKRFPYNIDSIKVYNLTAGSNVVVRFNDSWYDHPAIIISTDVITRAAVALGKDISMQVMYWSYQSRCWLRVGITEKQIVHISKTPFVWLHPNSGDTE